MNVGSSEIYRIYSKGPRIEPWGTPKSKETAGDWEDSIDTQDDLEER